MLAKPTVHSSWGAASVSGKPEPCANKTNSKRRSPVNKDCPFALVFRTKREQLANAAKGEQLLSVASNAVVDFLTEFRTWKPGKSLRAG